VIYEYAGGAKLFANCRQQSGCINDISAHVMGARGTAALTSRGMEILTDAKWVYQGEKNNHFLTEHQELFAGIRRGSPINNGLYMANSTLMDVMASSQ